MKINLKFLININVKAETFRLLEENRGEGKIWGRKRFLDEDTKKAQNIKEKRTDKIELHKN